ncbi:MAG: ABC transporter ATP-binding protein [Magnetospiraceae bacterium]
MEAYRQNSVLHVEDLYQAFGAKVVLDDIDLSVRKGELVTVVGPSGCGKSTLLRIIIGQDTPVQGKVFLDGDPISAPDTRRGVVYQHYSLFPNLSALDNVLVGHRLKVWPWQWPSARKALRDEAMAYLETAGLADHAGKYPHQLSGGQRQRVAIVQALIQKPMILCMDEPFSALDPGTRESMQMFLLDLWEKNGMTVFFVTHDLEEAAYLGTRLIGLSQYYSDDREMAAARGAKIVVDREISPLGTALSPEVKRNKDFRDLIRHIREQAFDPEYRQHAREFDLSHPQSWRTTSPGA